MEGIGGRGAGSSQRTDAAIRRGSRSFRRRAFIRRRAAAAGLLAVVVAGLFLLRSGPQSFLPDEAEPGKIRGSAAWGALHYGDADAPGFKTRYIVEIDFLGRAMLVHRHAKRHFLRLERIFEARAPAYSATVAWGEWDDWSYLNRSVRGGTAKSNHALGIAIDINALSNAVGTPGDMPVEVVRQWEAEGGEWGGDWTRPDPMHFETHLTPREIKRRYRSDGTVREWYLKILIGG